MQKSTTENIFNKAIIVRMDEDLHKKIKIYCAEKCLTIQDCIEKILKDNFK